MNRRLTTLALALVSAVSFGQTPYLTEVFVNPSNGGGSDNGSEFFELQGTPGFDLAGYSLLVVECDAVSTRGNVTGSYLMTGSMIGSNGLFLWRDAVTAIHSGVPRQYLNGPNSGASVKAVDFNPDIQNGSQTYILGFGTAPSVGTDLDSDNDGVLNVGALAGFTIVDAVGFVDNAPSETSYAPALGYAEVAGGNLSGNLYRIPVCSGGPGNWAAAFSLGAMPGPYAFDSNAVGFPFGPGASWTADPGRRNLCPATLTMSVPSFEGAPTGGPVTVSITNGVPGALYLTAFSTDSGNFTSPYTGPHAGLVISDQDLLTQYLFAAEPFVGVLNGSGSMTFTSGPIPVVGTTLYAASVLYGEGFSSVAEGAVSIEHDFSGRTAVVSVNL